MSKSKGLVFLCYNRDADNAVAHLVETELNARGYTVFIDVKILPSGDFELHASMILERADSVALILSESAVNNNSSHQAKEIIDALEHKKNIVPIIPANFDWDLAVQKAPWVGKVRHLNSVVVSYDYRDAFFERLERFLQSGSTQRVQFRKWWEFWKVGPVLPRRLRTK